MGWFKEFIQLEEKKGKIPPPYGDISIPSAQANSKKMEEKRQEREKHDKAAEGMKLVVTGAKIQCPLCTNPIGTLMVTDMNPTIKNKPIATEKDKQKTNLMFTGTCSKSPNAAAPCIAVIQPGQWMDTGKVKVQNSAPLLFKSSIKCMFGAVDIKFIDCGQTP